MEIAVTLPTVNIAMLGASGVGKTSFMARLYSRLQEDVCGLSIRATQSAVHDDLKQLGAAVARGSYPPGTAFRTDYEFLLLLRGEAALRFHWHDYFGQALDRVDTDTQTHALLRDLETMDALLLFCDADDLRKGRSGIVNILAAMSLANAALSATPRAINVVFVLTKADLIDTWSGSMLRPIEGLMGGIAAKQSLKGAIVPVSCTDATRDVALPLLFVLRCAAKRHLSEQKDAEATANRQSEDWREKSRGFWGFLRAIDDILSGLPTDAEMAQRCSARAEESRLLRVALEPSAAALARATSRVVRLKKGLAAEDYAAMLGSTTDAASTRDARTKTHGIWR
jgi:hypothetical protein